HARELAGDGKPEPRAAETLCGCGIALGKFVEQPRLLLPLGGAYKRAHGSRCLAAAGPLAHPVSSLRCRKSGDRKSKQTPLRISRNPHDWPRLDTADRNAAARSVIGIAMWDHPYRQPMGGTYES